jgi:hypothetical protein
MRCDTATPSELDHHLPKRKFSEFAVLTLNLIPCCHLCNQKKGSKHLDTEGCPLFLHPFFDVLPMDEGYLCVEISFAALTGFLISFHVQQTESMSAEVFARLEKQFRELDLRTLYMRSALEDLRERRDAFYVIFETEGVSGMIQELSRSASSVENAHHKNFWKARVLRTLAADAAFCNGGFKALGPQELLT